MDNIILFLMCYHSLILKFETNGFATLFSRDIRFTPRSLPPSSIIVTTSHSLIIVTKWFRFLEVWCCRYWHLGSFANLQLNCLLCFSVCAFAVFFTYSVYTLYNFALLIRVLVLFVRVSRLSCQSSVTI